MIEILSASALATVQDLGREGGLRWGVGTSGAMDPLALAAGNLLLGNEEDAAGVEVPVFPFQVRFTEDCAFAVTGADCNARLDDAPLLALVGARSARRSGAEPGPAAGRGRAGALAAPTCAWRAASTCPTVLGSRSTQLRGAFGGHRRACAAARRRAARRRTGAWAAPDRLRPRAAGAGRCHCRSMACPRCACCPRPSTRATPRLRARPSGAKPGRSRPRAIDTATGWPGHRSEPVAAAGDALARHRAGRHPGAGRRPADRADARRAALRRLPQDRHRDRGRPLAAGPGAYRQPHPLRRNDLGRSGGRARRDAGAWLGRGAPPARLAPAEPAREEADACTRLDDSTATARLGWLATGHRYAGTAGPGDASAPAARRRDAGRGRAGRYSTTRRGDEARRRERHAHRQRQPRSASFLHRHPLREEPLARRGTRVRAGQALGLAANRRAAAAGDGAAGWRAGRRCWWRMAPPWATAHRCLQLRTLRSEHPKPWTSI